MVAPFSAAVAARLTTTGSAQGTRTTGSASPRCEASLGSARRCEEDTTWTDTSGLHKCAALAWS